MKQPVLSANTLIPCTLEEEPEVSTEERGVDRGVSIDACDQSARSYLIGRLYDLDLLPRKPTQPGLNMCPSGLKIRT